MKAKDILNILEEEIIPSLDKWNMYAGGTSAEEGKHSYDYVDKFGTKWSIAPISNKWGRHIGYNLTAFRLAKNTGYSWIDPVGNVWFVPTKLFRSPQEAVKIAKKVAGEVER